jgi:Big-like domain-containing protein/legume-like lectin family protein
MPTNPTTDLTPSGINLHSGDIFSVHIVYDGTALSMRMVNTVTPWVSFSKSWDVDIPAAVGSQSAFVGFTGSTGTLSGIQDVLAWTYYTPNSTHTPAPTTTSLTSSANSSIIGQSVIFTAKVTSSSGTPTGTVILQDGPTTLNRGTLDRSGITTLAISSLSLGSHVVSAFYTGDSLFAASASDSLTQVVNPPPPPFTMSATTDTKTIHAGQSATFELSVIPQNGSPATVAMACAGAPPLASCVIQPIFISLSSSEPHEATATITTTAHTTAASHMPIAESTLLLITGLIVIWKGPRRLLAIASVGFLVISIVSCGSSNIAMPAKLGSGGTPSGTYRITVTATSRDFSQVVNIMLVVQ